MWNLFCGIYLYLELNFLDVFSMKNVDSFHNFIALQISLITKCIKFHISLKIKKKDSHFYSNKNNNKKKRLFLAAIEVLVSK